MISKLAGFKTEDGKFHGTEEAARKHLLDGLVRDYLPPNNGDLAPGLSEFLFKNRDRLIAILSCKPSNKPLPKKRGRKAATIAATPPAGDEKPRGSAALPLALMEDVKR